MGKLGYSSLTLTDITETIPISLVLQSNLGNNIQTRTGSLYDPDFTTGELIITPLLYMGTAEIEVPVGEKGDIYYEITGEGETHFTYDNTEESDSIYVDEKGCLHFKKNLSASITIEAYVKNYENEEHNYIVELISAANPISVLFLDGGKTGGYTMAIEASRTYFTSTEVSPITLTAHLYKGVDEVVNDILYSWNNVSGNFSGEEASVSVARNDVSTTEIFQCVITLNDGSELTFKEQIAIRDFADEITSNIMASSSLVLTPKNTSVTLTNQVFNAAQLINGENNEEDLFSYSWKILYSNKEIEIEGETNRQLTIDLTEKRFKELQENFTVACITIMNEKTRTVAFVNITYSPISIDVAATQSVVINVDKEGNYSGESFSAQVRFQLTDEEKNPVDYEDETSTINCQYQDGEPTQVEGKWDFTFNLRFTKEEIDGLANDSTNFIKITYTYLSEPHTYEIPIIKNYAGADGVAAYSIELTNDYVLFAGNETTAVAGQEVQFGITGNYGGEEMSFTSVKVEEREFDAAASSEDVKILDGLLISYNSGTKLFTLKTTADDENGFLSSSGRLDIYVSFEKPNNAGELSWHLYLNYGINYNGSSYYLTPSVNQISYLAGEYRFSAEVVHLTTTYRNRGLGANIAFDGYITYSIDDGDEIALDGNDFYTNVLTSSNHTVKFNLYNDSNKELLLDTETLLVSISYENVEIGGENLIRWSGTFTDWEYSNKGEEGIEEIIIAEEYNGIYSATFSKNTTSFDSPDSIFDASYQGKTFCCSYYIYSDDWSAFGENDYITSSLIFDTEEKFSIGEVYPNNSAATTMIFCDELKDGEWCRVYHIFTLFLENYEDVSSFSWYIESTNSGCKFRQSKLEIGNVPTGWTISPFDTDDIIIEKTENGEYAYNSLGTLEETISSLEASLGDLKANTESYQIDTDGYLSLIKSSISIVTSESEPYVEIKTTDTGNDTSMSTKITNNKMEFCENGQAVAYISSNTLNINSAVFNRDFSIGDLKVSITDTGVGFSW